MRSSYPTRAASKVLWGAGGSDIGPLLEKYQVKPPCKRGLAESCYEHSKTANTYVAHAYVMSDDGAAQQLPLQLVT